MKGRSIEAAAAFVDRAGIALVFPKQDVVLPSLWEAVAGPGPLRWAVERDDGKLEFTPEMDAVWRLKDELPGRKLACAGKHVRGWPALLSLDVLPALYALRPDAEMSPLERDIADAVRDGGPATAPDIRRRIGSKDTAKVNRTIDALQRLLVLTRAGVVQQEHGWPAGSFDLLTRRFSVKRLPKPDAARDAIATVILRAARELSAEDLRAATGWSRRDATAALEGLADGGHATRRTVGAVRLWRWCQ